MYLVYFIWFRDSLEYFQIIELDDSNAEEVVVENIDNIVLFLMTNESEATSIKEAFMNLAQSK